MTKVCPNCGAPRDDAFCGQCGQNDRVYMRSTVSLAKDMVIDQLDLDSRLFRTLKALLLEPGRLTREFVSNRRARYVSPVRLYLSISVVFFFVLSLTGDIDLTTFRAEDSGIINSEADAEFIAMFEELSPSERTRVHEIVKKRGLVDDAVEKQLEDIESKDSTPVEVSPQEQEIRQKLLDMFENPKAATDTVVNRLPVALFITLPMYAAFLKLLYWRRYYAEHLVFALHLHAFLFVLGALMIAMPENAPGEAVIRVLQLIGGVYYFLALHRTYPQPWLTTFGKFVVINALHVTLIATAIALTTFLTLFF